MKKLIVALIAATAAMSAAQAQTTQTSPRTYVGVGIASADHNYSSVNGLNVTDNDGYSGNAKIFGGYELNQNWGAEIGYTDFRNSNFNYNVAGVNGRGASDGSSYYLAGKYQYPINDQVAVYGKLGVERSLRYVKDVGAFDQSYNDTGAYASVGVQYNFTPQVGVVAEYERYGKEKDFGAKPDAWTIGARYSF
ncbi:MAG TPA: porin family protein [Telluria sp.]|jgi:OOP family OmpA-OmpF porin